MFPEALFLMTEDTMSPELVDQAVLACCKPQFLKVARVIFDTAKVLKVPFPIEGIFVDDPEEFEEPTRTGVGLIVARIKALVKAKRLESAGDVDRWRYSEIRLTGK
jgi:hypothetical protein